MKSISALGTIDVRILTRYAGFLFALIALSGCLGGSEPEPIKDDVPGSAQFWFINEKACSEPIERVEVVNWTRAPTLPGHDSGEENTIVPSGVMGVGAFYTANPGTTAAVVEAQLYDANGTRVIGFHRATAITPNEDRQSNMSAVAGAHTFRWSWAGWMQPTNVVMLAYVCPGFSGTIEEVSAYALGGNNATRQPAYLAVAARQAPIEAAQDQGSSLARASDFQVNY